jgi:hypothetical protein
MRHPRRLVSLQRRPASVHLRITVYLRQVSEAAARRLAVVFFFTTLGVGAALAASWMFFLGLTLRQPLPPTPQMPQPSVAAVRTSPLVLSYHLDLPGRGELFPAMQAAPSSDYWPLAVLSISNTGSSPALQLVTAEVPGWSERWQQTLVVGAHETRVLPLAPSLLARAFGVQEIQRATLHVSVSGADGITTLAETRPVLVHSASDLYWGKQFANAQVVARWVTPHDPAVLALVSSARRYIARGRLGGYNVHPGAKMATQVEQQARAVFEAMRRSGISYVSSIFTFGDFTTTAQRIRLPRETLSLRTANCIDVSVAFASAMENLGLQPVVVIVPGHAFAGVRLAPDSSQVLYIDLTVLPNGNFDAAVKRAQGWLRQTPPERVLTVDVSSARRLGVFPFAPPSASVASAAAPVPEAPMGRGSSY